MIQFVVLAGGALNLAGSLRYAWNTLKGRSQPNRITFLLWAAAPLIAAAAGFAQGGRWEVLPVFMCGFGPLLILCASFIAKSAHWELRRFDYICGAFSILALILWRITHEPDIAIAFAIISDALASIPTVRKAWTHPRTETLSTYIAALLNQFTAFLAAPRASFAAYAFPIYLILCCGLIVGILIYRRSGKRA